MISLETMQDISDILDNRILIVALAACLIAQALKVVFDFAHHRKVNFRVLVETGGMPSSHSARWCCHGRGRLA